MKQSPADALENTYNVQPGIRKRSFQTSLIENGFLQIFANYFITGINMEKNQKDDTQKQSMAERTDLRVRAAIGRMFSSISPNSSILAWADWMLHLAVSPGKKAELTRQAWMDAWQLTLYAQHAMAGNGAEKQPVQDRRFSALEWQNGRSMSCSRRFYSTNAGGKKRPKRSTV